MNVRCENIETVTGTKNTHADHITSFQEKLAEPFIKHLTDKHFLPLLEILSKALSSCDPRKVPSVHFKDLS